MQHLKTALLALVLIGLIGNLRAEDNMAHSKEPLKDIKKAVDDKKAVLLDVREKDEWDEEHVKEAQLAPLSSLKATNKAPADLPKDQPIYIHCAVGVRSVAAAKILKKLGYDARPLKQGVDDLKEAGFVPAKK